LKIIYYTSGVSGSGRIVRGISIDNALKRKKINCEFIIINSSSFAYLCDLTDIQHIEIPAENQDQLSKTNCINSVLYHTIDRLNPDILIIDMLWFSIYHFIDEIKCKKIFICHNVIEDFFSIELPSGKLTINPKQYDLLLSIEPFQCSIPMKSINPILLRNKEEIFSREEAMARLNIDMSKETCLYAFNNHPGDFDKYKAKYSYLENAYQMVYTTNYKGGLFPVVDYFNAFDYIVCGAGYNMFWEVVFFNKEATFENFPLKFDRTEHRINNCQEFYFEENGADQLIDIIMNL
jgi:hypothetical protein